MLLSAEYPPHPGGVGDYTRRLGQALARRGHEVTVLTTHDSQFVIHEVCGHRGQSETLSPQAQRQNRATTWGWGCWESIVDALDRRRPDVLHIQYQTGAYAMHPAINLLPWRLRHLPGRPPVAVTAHDLLLPYLFPKAGPLRRWVTRRLLADADAVVVTNAEDYAQVARDWRLEIGDAKVRANLQSPTPNLRSPALIPIGSNILVAPPDLYDRAAHRAALGIGADDTLIAYFGLIGRSKGLDVAARALARLPRGFRLLVIGGAATAPEDRAYAAEVRGLIDQLDLRQRVTITGHCAEAEVSAHLLAADMAALPFVDGASFRRGSLLAALAHGLPTITTLPTTDHRPPTTDHPEQRTKNREQTTDHRLSILYPLSSIFSRTPSPPLPLSPAPPLPLSSSPPPGTVPRLVDGEHAMLVPPADAAALATAIERLAGDVELRGRLRSGGQALAERFSWATIAEQHEALYQALRRQQHYSRDQESGATT